MYLQVAFWNGLITALGIVYFYFKCYQVVGFVFSNILLWSTYYFMNKLLKIGNK